MKPVTEEDIERELQQLLTVEPSANYVARIRTAVANQPTPSGVSGILGGFAVSLCTVLCVAGVVYFAWPTGDPTVASTPYRQESVDTRPAPDRPAAPVEISEGRDVSPAGNRARRIVARPRFEVVVSTDEREAFERLVRGTEDGTVALSFEETNQKLTMAELTITPITTEPLAISEQQGVLQ
jgi:hypothetical protein